MALQISPSTFLATSNANTLLTAGNTSLTPVGVNVTGTPPNIDQLLRQIQINGTVSSPADNGAVTLTTALGNFSFSLAQLPDNVKQQLIQQLDSLFQSQKQITAVIQPGSPPTDAVLLLPTSTTAPQLTSPLQQPVLPQQPLTLTPGETLQAVVLPSDIIVPGAPTTPPATAATQPTPITTTSPPPATDQPTTPLTPNTPQPPTATTTPQTTTQPASAQTPVPLLQPGKEITIRIDAFAPPSAPPPTPTAPTQIQATVIGNGPNGQLILKTDDATLYVRANTDAPIGTTLLITPEAAKTPPPALLQPVDTQDFASLQETLTTLAQINPQLAQQFIETHIPQPTLQLAGPLLFFLSALKQGDAKGWLGSDINEAMIKTGKLELLTKLLRDIGASPQTEHDPAVGEWKSYPVPLQMNGQFQPLTLHVHADGRSAQNDKAEGTVAKQTRFLIDIRMSRLGALQLDGLVRPKKLDMIVRSETALPAGLPQDLRNSYLASLETLGFTGSLSFQTGKQTWITPRKQPPHPVIT